MNTETIAQEIVDIRARLAELDEQIEGHDGTDGDDERARLHDRLRHLQDLISGGASESSEIDSPAEPDSVHYLPPA